MQPRPVAPGGRPGVSARCPPVDLDHQPASTRERGRLDGWLALWDVCGLELELERGVTARGKYLYSRVPNKTDSRLTWTVFSVALAGL